MFKSPNLKRRAMLLLTAMLTLNSMGAAQALPALRGNQKVMRSKSVVAMPRMRTPYVADTLLVKLKNPTNRSTFEGTLAPLGARIERTIGGGEIEILLVQTKRGELESTERKLKDDPLVKFVQRDFIAKAQFAHHGPNPNPNDPDFINQQSYLNEFGLPDGWAQARGGGVTIGVADSGIDRTNMDLLGKVGSGSDMFRWRTTYGLRFYEPVSGDPTGHGTVMATVMAAKGDNRFRSVGIARDASIMPFTVSRNDQLDEAKLVEAIYLAGAMNIRIMNVSFADPGYASNYSNQFLHPALWDALIWYRDQKNGLAFFPMKHTNENELDSLSPYIIKVGGYDMTYATINNVGQGIWFAAPGVGIQCSGLRGEAKRESGTSLSTAMISGVAACILSKNPSLTNNQVLDIMRRSCDNTTPGQWNNTFGFGVPRVDRALQMVPAQQLYWGRINLR
jgi:subtilisin family serine protease